MRYGGWDVTLASLEAQTTQEFTWIIGDSLPRHLDDMPDPKPGFDVWRVYSGALTDKPMSLCAAYNRAIQEARRVDADLLVSLQDYTWIPPNGVERFQYLSTLYPDSLLTGLCSHSKDPFPWEVTRPQGPFTVFNQPYDGHKPRETGWHDVRENEAKRRYGHDGPIYTGIDVEWWEANWAAIPRQLLHDERLVFNEEYDRAVGHENQDYALHAEALGYHRVLDTSNHAVAMPHRDYFPHEATELERLRHSNMVFHQGRRAAAAGPRMGAGTIVVGMGR